MAKKSKKSRKRSKARRKGSRHLTPAQIRAGFGGKRAQAAAGGGKRKHHRKAKGGGRKKARKAHHAHAAHAKPRRKGKRHTHWAGIAGYHRKSSVRSHRRRTNPLSGALGSALKTAGIAAVTAGVMAGAKLGGRVLSPTGNAELPIDGAIFAGGLAAAAFGHPCLGAAFAAAAATDAVSEELAARAQELVQGAVAPATTAARSLQSVRAQMGRLQTLGAIRTLSAVQSSMGALGTVRAQMGSVRAQMGSLSGGGGLSNRFAGSRSYMAGGGGFWGGRRG